MAGASDNRIANYQHVQVNTQVYELTHGASEPVNPFIMPFDSLKKKTPQTFWSYTGKIWEQPSGGRFLFPLFGLLQYMSVSGNW